MRKRSAPFTLGMALAMAAFVWPESACAVVGPLRGLPLTEVIERLMAEGLPVVYSSDLVTPGLRVASEPQATGARELLDELLAPHGLMLREMASGRLVIVQRPRAQSTMPAVPPPATGPHLAAALNAPLTEIVVTGSRYRFDRLPEPGQFTFAAADLERMPDLGDDPLRAIARLPGAATGGFTAKSSIRGGEVDETLVRFDGFRLHNPFHLKDFQSIFSTIDPALVRSVEVHTGGYPVALGDRMSGVIDIVPLAPPPQRVGLVSLGLFSAGVLAGDSFDDEQGDWLLSARRGNLDLLIDAVDPKRGRPRYFDLHARVGRRITERLALRGNVLVFEDDLEISDTDQEEQATASYRDRYFWLGADWEPRDDLQGRSHIGLAELDSERRGTAEQPGIASGELADERDSRIVLVETRWQWQQSDALRVDFGGEFRRADGRYDYADAVDFDLLFATPGAPQQATRQRSLSLRPDGVHAAAFLSAQYELMPQFVADLGLRYDYDTLPETDDDQWSPRLGIAWRPRDDLGLSLAWGRFAQSQSVQELQVSDGVAEYLPAQRADHLLLGLRYRPTEALELRVDGYQKRYRQLRPRYENLLNSFVILPELKPDRIRIAADSAAAHGVELSVQGRRDAALNWWANYSWSQVEDRLDGVDITRSWDQTHALGAGLGWHDERWDFGAALTWRSGWPTTAVALASMEPIPIVAVEERNAQRLGAYFSVDLRAARRFVFDRSMLTVYLEVTNAANRRNECCVEYEFNTEEESPFLELDTEPYLPTLPNIGFVWEF